MPPKSTVATNLKIAMKNAGMTQIELGAAFGCNQSTISKIFRGVTHPDAEDLIRFGDILGVSPEFFYADNSAGDAKDREFRIAVGARVARLRNDAGLRQEDLAELLGLKPDSGRAQVSMWERGVNAVPSSLMSAIADVLQTTIDYLCGRTDDPAPRTFGGGLGGSVKPEDIRLIEEQLKTLPKASAIEELNRKMDRLLEMVSAK